MPLLLFLLSALACVAAVSSGEGAQDLALMAMSADMADEGLSTFKDSQIIG